MTDERSEAERDEEAIEHLKAQLTSANAEIWRLKRDRNDHHYATDQLAAKDATIAAQAAEIERLTDMVKILHDRSFDTARDWVESDAVKDAELAALRSQLEEQRKMVRDAKEIRFANEVTIETVGENKWVVNDEYGYGTLEDENGLPKIFDSVREAYQAAIAANWLTPHAEKDGGE